MAYRYPRDQQLHTLPVFSNDGHEYFEITGLPEFIPFGKTSFVLNVKQNSATGLRLKPRSGVTFEVRDSQQNLIFSNVTKLRNINGGQLCYIWIREDPLYFNNKLHDISNGIGSIVVVGTLHGHGIPQEYQDRYNVKLVHHIDIRKKTANQSPV